MALWDVARDTLRCWRRRCVIGAGESYRLLKSRQPICEACSVELDGTAAPADMPVLTNLERMGLRMPAYQPPPPGTPDLSYFPASRLPARPRKSVMRAVRRSLQQPSLRLSERPAVDFRQRAAGERDE